MTDGVREELIAVGAAIAISAAVVGYALRPKPAADGAALAPQVLPGMVVKLPGTPVMNGTYDSGMAQVDRDGLTTAVAWSSGDSLDDATLARMVEGARGAKERVSRTAVTAGPLRDVTVGGAPGRAVTLTAGSETSEMSYVLCGGRLVTIFTEEAATGPALHPAIRDSFSCRPELRQVAMTPELAVDRRDGWYVVPAGDLRAWTNGTGSAVMVRVVAAKKGEEQAFIERAVANSGAAMTLGPRQERPVAGGTRPLWVATGDERDIALSVWTCPSGHRVLGVASTRHGEDLAPAIDLLLTARCLKPGEASPEYPAPPGQ